MKPAIIALTLALVSAGCRGGSSTSPATVTASQTQAASSPEDCLSQAGLSNVEQRDTDLWRGSKDLPCFLVTVKSLPPAAQANKAAQQADLVDAYAAGRYLVTGPVTSADDQGITQAVADCLA